MQNILQIAIQLQFFKNFSQWQFDVRVGTTFECFNKISGHPFEFDTDNSYKLYVCLWTKSLSSTFQTFQVYIPLIILLCAFCFRFGDLLSFRIL